MTANGQKKNKYYRYILFYLYFIYKDNAITFQSLKYVEVYPLYSESCYCIQTERFRSVGF